MTGPATSKEYEYLNSIWVNLKDTYIPTLKKQENFFVEQTRSRNFWGEAGAKATDCRALGQELDRVDQSCMPARQVMRTKHHLCKG